MSVACEYFIALVEILSLHIVLNKIMHSENILNLVFC